MHSETSSVESLTITSRRKASITSKVARTLKDNVQKSLKGKKDFLLDFDRFEDEEPPPQRYVPERLEILSKDTGLEKRQLRSLYRAFKEACPNGAINEITFRNIYCQLFPLGADGNAYAHYIFKALDKRQSGNLTFSELVRGLSCLIKGSLQERLKWIFRLYDIDHDGEISRGEMSAVIGAIHDLIGPSDDQSERHTNLAFQKLDLNHDGVITIDEFMTYCFSVRNKKKNIFKQHSQSNKIMENTCFRMTLCGNHLRHLIPGSSRKESYVIKNLDMDLNFYRMPLPLKEMYILVIKSHYYMETKFVKGKIKKTKPPLIYKESEKKRSMDTNKP